MARSVSAVPPLAAGYLYVRPLASATHTDAPDRLVRIQRASGSTDHGSHEALARFVMNPGVQVPLLPLGRLVENARALSPAARPSARSANQKRFPIHGTPIQTDTGALAERVVVSQRLQAAIGPSTLRSASKNGRVVVSARLHQRSNPSVEGTHNGGARLRAPSRSQAPLCAPHVER